MDKYEYRVSLNEINSLVEEKRFDEAAQIADTIDWRKVKSKDTLCRISDIYKICKDYERARDILDLANQRNPHVPEIIYSLCELTIFLYGQTGSQSDLAKAIGLKQEFQSAYPDDPKRLILEYKFYKVSPVTVAEKIATLEQLRDEDHSARWGYELASLYHEADMDELALDECGNIRRMFGGRFADRAAALEQELRDAAGADNRDRGYRDANEAPADRDRDRETARPEADGTSAGDGADESDPSDRMSASAEDRAEREPAREIRRAAAYEDAEPVRGERTANIPVDEALPEEAPAEERIDERPRRETGRFRTAALAADEMAAESEAEPEQRRMAVIAGDTQGGDTGISGIRRKPYREAPAPERQTQPVPDSSNIGNAAEGVRRLERIVPEEPTGDPEAGQAVNADDQLSVGQVYDEWERIRRDIRKRNDEKRAQRIIEGTGPLLQDFDETARHGLIESIEKDAARQRRQIRSGAASILGNGYNGGYGSNGGYRENDMRSARTDNDGYRDRGRYGSQVNSSYDQGYEESAGGRYDDRYAVPAEDDYNGRRATPVRNDYDDRYAAPARNDYDDRYAAPARDDYDDRYTAPAGDGYNDRYTAPAGDDYDDRYAAPAEEDRDRYEDSGEQRMQSRRNVRLDYEPLPEPVDYVPAQDEILAETVHEEPEYEDAQESGARGYVADASEDNVRDGINDRCSGIDMDAPNVIPAQDAARGARFAAAVAAVDAADIAGDIAGDSVERLADEDDDVATKRWNSDEIREAMERQRVRIAEAQAAAEEEARRQAEEEERRKAEEEAARKAAEEEARRQAEEEAARKAAEEKAAAEAAMRARIEAEIRAEYEAKERARIEAEEAARKAAEEEARRKAEEEAKAREAAEARERMRAEIEAQIRAEYEAKARKEQDVVPAAELASEAETEATEPADGLAAEDAPTVEPDPAWEADRIPETSAADREAEEPELEFPKELRESLESVDETEDGLGDPVFPADAFAGLEQDAGAGETTNEEMSRNEEIPAETESVPADLSNESEAAEDAAEDRPAEDVMESRKGRRRPRRARTIDDDLAQPATMETTEMPASAASSIAAAAEKPPSEEELKLFGPFYRMKENRDQVTAALDKISLASYTGNIIITGNAVTARRVAQGLLELTREADSNFTGKIAKATGSALNKLSQDRLGGILKKIENGALIIEHASVMDETAVQNLYNELENRDRGVIVVMMDARKPLDAFLTQYSGQMGSFTARVDIRPLNDKALVDYGKDYANTRDYALDELAELALSSRISSMQSPNHRVTLKEVRDIIDEAISYASRKTPQMLMSRISGKRYDADDRIILREKDFQHLK